MIPVNFATMFGGLTDEPFVLFCAALNGSVKPDAPTNTRGDVEALLTQAKDVMESEPVEVLLRINVPDDSPLCAELGNIDKSKPGSLASALQLTKEMCPEAVVGVDIYRAGSNTFLGSVAL